MVAATRAAMLTAWIAGGTIKTRIWSSDPGAETQFVSGLAAGELSGGGYPAGGYDVSAQVVIVGNEAHITIDETDLPTSVTGGWAVHVIDRGGADSANDVIRIQDVRSGGVNKLIARIEASTIQELEPSI